MFSLMNETGDAPVKDTTAIRLPSARSVERYRLRRRARHPSLGRDWVETED
jgi:hypothetical protein